VVGKATMVTNYKVELVLETVELEKESELDDDASVE
jgi:hypothetical protein